MVGRRRLYTGEESAARGLTTLRLASVGGLLITAAFVLVFDRAKHDPVLSAGNPFAEDPYDAVGSFGIQLGIVVAVLAALRAFLTDLKTETFSNRVTYTVRALAVSQLAIVVTMIADLAALIRFIPFWNNSRAAELLLVFTVGLLVLASGFCIYLVRMAKRRGVCSRNPLRQSKFVPFLFCVGLLSLYPPGWREGIAGAILTAAFGMMVLFLSVAFLSRAMFPCPDVPEKDLLDDLARLIPVIGRLAASPVFIRFTDRFNPRKHRWILVVFIALIMGVWFAMVEVIGEGVRAGDNRGLVVISVFVALEAAGVLTGYTLLGRFLGLFRSDT